MLDGSIYLHDISQPLRLAVLREGARVALDVRVLEQAHQADPVLDPTDTQKNVVPQLGAIAATITPELQARLGGLRIPGGVAVVARTADVSGVELAAGDVIHAVNSSPITDVEALRDLLGAFKRGDPVVLQVERRGGLEFVAFELN